MTPRDPQFIYMILALPTLFGLVLIGEGLNKAIHEEWSGIISIVSGLVFIGIVVIVYLLFSSYLSQKV